MKQERAWHLGEALRPGRQGMSVPSSRRARPRSWELQPHRAAWEGGGARTLGAVSKDAGDKKLVGRSQHGFAKGEIMPH